MSFSFTGNNTDLHDLLRNLQDFAQQRPTSESRSVPEPTPATESFQSGIQYHDLNEIVYIYNKTMVEYYQTFQKIVETNTTPRINSNDLRHLIYYMNLNIQTYHSIMKQCIDLVQTMYLSRMQTPSIWSTPGYGTAPYASQMPSYRPQTASPSTQPMQNIGLFGPMANTTRLPPPPPPPPPIADPVELRTNIRPWIDSGWNGHIGDDVGSNIATGRIPITRDSRISRPVRSNLGTYFLNSVLTGSLGQTNVEPAPGLTQDQIDEYTESYTWSDTGTETVCPISLESFSTGDQIMRIRACGHDFKSQYLLRWFQRHSGCPVCRQPVMRMVVPARTVSEQPDHDSEIPNVNTDISGSSTSLSSSSIDALLDRFLSNELEQIMNQDLTPILRQYLGQNIETSAIDVPTASLEVFREIIPIDIEYRIEFDPSGSRISRQEDPEPSSTDL